MGLPLQRGPAARHDLLAFEAMPESTDGLPPALARTLRQFRMLGREDKMQALLSWSKKLEPLPERFAALDRALWLAEHGRRVRLAPFCSPRVTPRNLLITGVCP